MKKHYMRMISLGYFPLKLLLSDSIMLVKVTKDLIIFRGENRNNISNHQNMECCGTATVSATGNGKRNILCINLLTGYTKFQIMH